VTLAIAGLHRSAYAIPMPGGSPAPVIKGEGAAVIKVAIQKVGASTASVAWVPPTSWNHWESIAGEARKADGVDRKPTAIAATIQNDAIEGLTKGDAVVIYKLSDTPWFISTKAGGSIGTPTAGILATGWSY